MGKVLVVFAMAMSAAPAADAINAGPPLPASVPALDGWGGVLLIGLLGGVLGRWLAKRTRQK